MNEHRFVNKSQPQTLVMAVIICYVTAAINLLYVFDWWILGFVAVALAVGGYGIANEKRWGYTLAIAAAAVRVLLVLNIYGKHTFTDINALLDFLFYGALIALLVHPMSRDYQRIWFR